MDKQKTALIKACRGLIKALRAQSRLALDLGGEIALNEGNWPAFKEAEKAIFDAKKED